jgi:hypothetical protein
VAYAPPPPTEPEIAVLVVLTEPDARWLRASLRSIVGQSSAHWRLSVTAVGPLEPEIDAVVHEELAALAPGRAVLHALPAGTPPASCAAAALEAGTSPAFLLAGQHDRLAPDAIALLASALIDADVAYADEDWTDEADGLGCDPVLKPDWSPDLALSWCYTGRPVAYRVAPVIAAGGIQPLPGGDWEHDVLLRVTERTARVAHVAEVQCHRRPLHRPGERCATGPAAVTAALDRRREDAEVVAGPLARTWRVVRRVRPSCSVSAIVPFRDSARRLRACVDSV